jgi:hypothetical protein
MTPAYVSQFNVMKNVGHFEIGFMVWPLDGEISKHIFSVISSFVHMIESFCVVS